MDLTTLVNNDRLLSPPVTPKSYPMDTLSKHYHHQHDDDNQRQEEDLLPTVIYIPPVSPPASMDTIAAASDRHHQKTFKFHLERQKALPSSIAASRPFLASSPSVSPSPPPPIKTSTAAQVVPEIVIPEPLRPSHYPSKQHPRPSDVKNQDVYHEKLKMTTTTTKKTTNAAASAAKAKKATSVNKPTRAKQIPLRSLSSDAADHAFSFYFNAKQVQQYGMQAILQRERQEEQRRLGSSYHCLYHQHHRSRQDNNNDDGDNNNNKETTIQEEDDEGHMTYSTAAATTKRPSNSDASTLASQADRHMKKAKTEAAAAYDRVDVTADDCLVYDPEWVPLYDVFDRKPNVRPTYKANSPLQIDHMEFYDRLHPCEANIASQLRLQPKQYLMCKRSLILGAQDSYKKDVPFRKSDAQKLCRIDVNKVSHLWALFARLGWLEPHHRHHHPSQ